MNRPLTFAGLCLLAAPTLRLTAAVAAPPPEQVTEEAAMEMPKGPDRSTPPTVEPATPLSHPDPVRKNLSPGVDLFFVPAKARKVSVVVTMHHGSLDLPDLTRATTDALGELWDVGTADHKPEAFSVAQDKHQAYISAGLTNHALEVSLSVPKENLNRGLDLLREALHTPSFDGKELKRWKRDTTLDIVSDAPTEPGRVARAASYNGWFAADHPYSIRPNLDDIATIKRATLLEGAARLRTESPIQVLIVGDISLEAATSASMALLRGLGDPGERSARPEVPDHTGTRVIAVDMPGLPQTTLSLAMDAPATFHEDELAFTTANFALGGTFLSRLNSNLREDKGFTYGIYSRYSPSKSYGRWVTQTEVRADNTGAAMQEIMRELDIMVADGATAAEIDAQHRDRIGGWNDTFRVASSAASLYDALLWRELSVADSLARLDTLGAMQPADTQAAAATWLSPTAGRLWVVVGDREAIEPQLKTLKLTPQWITPEQAILGVGF